MRRGRLVSLGVVVAVLLALAAVASRGRPLAGSGAGAGPTPGFFDYVFTTIVLAGAILGVAGLVLQFSVRPGRARAQGRFHPASFLVLLAGAAAFAYLLSHSDLARRLQQLGRERPAQPTQSAPAPPQAPPGTRGARLRWDEVAVVLALLAGAGVVALAARSRGRRALPRRAPSQEALTVALDESLDDLREDPDLRRAIIAAYARMERSLAGAGVVRRPAEAPLEYLERALRELDLGAAAVRRLTDLFEWAKFSQHEPEPATRDEAIAALVAVRDELRAPAARAAA